MTTRRTLGTLLFPEFELLDVFGPLEAFGNLFVRDRFRVVTIGATAGPVASAQGPQAIAEHALADCPPLDLLLVPGGMGTRREVDDETTLAWLRTRAADAEIVMSVCTGAALLARAGLLDGLPATTNKRAFDWVVTQGPRVDWKRRARWVDAGKMVTSSGVSAGTDMALAVIARLVDEKTAEQVARIMEWTRHRDPSDDPFARD
jgi:transcriptional regulator GlxA family with amidase domain